MLKFKQLLPQQYAEYSQMTFSDYRKLMTPQEKSIIVLLASMGENDVGLLIFRVDEKFKTESYGAALLSIYVKPFFREMGIATHLLKKGAEILKEKGFQKAQGQYQQEYKNSKTIEKLLTKVGWNYQPHRLLAYSPYAGQILEDPLLKRIKVPKEFEIFKWEDITESETAVIKAKFADKKRKKIYPPDLNPFTSYHDDFLRYNSVGLRYNGEVVAWVVAAKHHLPNITHFANMFSEPEYAKKGYGLVLVYEAIRLERAFLGENYEKHFGLWQVFYSNPKMISITERRLAQHCSKILHYNMATKIIEN